MAGSAGFSLVEIMISVVIFSAVVLVLAGLSFQVARRSTRATDRALIMSRMTSKLDRATTISYDSLSLLVTCDTTTTGLTKVIACGSVATTGARTSTVTLTVWTTVPGSVPDTVVIERGRIRRPVPLR